MGEGIGVWLYSYPPHHPLPSREGKMAPCEFVNDTKAHTSASQKRVLIKPSIYAKGSHRVVCVFRGILAPLE